MRGMLARHEWTLLQRSALVRVVAAVFVGALLLASALGSARAAREAEVTERLDARTASQRQAGREAAAASAATPIDTVPPRGPRHPDTVANERGRTVMMPPAPLVALSVGQTDVHPSYYQVTARALDSLVSGDQVEHPLSVATGQFDVAFVVLFLYPLLILAVTYDLTASERASGTLRMVLAQPVRLTDLVAGKLAARLVLIAGPVVVLPAVAAVAVAPALDGVLLLRLGVWTLVVMAYGGFWVGLSLVVNAWGRPAATNALVLAGLWMMLAVVGPACANLFITLYLPMPSRVEQAVQTRLATAEVSVQGSQQLGQFLQDHPTSSTVGAEGLRQFARIQVDRDREIARRLGAVSAAFDRQRERQRRLADWLGLLSPTMVAQGLLMDAAGTSTEHHDHYRAQVAAFQHEWQAFFEPRVLAVTPLTAGDYEAMPRLALDPEPAGAMVARSAGPLALVAAAGVALAWLGFRRYRGYPVG